ncbi:hypothetical protein [Sphingomonas faeni]|uniref:hypothetical protein n=1 Tax=Sphingomonas faeni TaxID=185950 RepID=UPI00335960F7
MAIIKTERNRVHAHARGEDDVLVRVSWFAYDEAGERGLRRLRYEPITECQATVDWAIAMTDRMAHLRHVVPFNADDMRAPSRFQPICDAVACMTDQKHGAMRQVVVTSAGFVLGACNDPESRADLFRAALRERSERFKG